MKQKTICIIAMALAICYILALNCTDDAAEEKATEKLSGLVKKYIVKSETVSDSGVELTVEVRITDGGTKFVNDLA